MRAESMGWSRRNSLSAFSCSPYVSSASTLLCACSTASRPCSSRGGGGGGSRGGLVMRALGGGAGAVASGSSPPIGGGGGGGGASGAGAGRFDRELMGCIVEAVAAAAATARREWYCMAGGDVGSAMVAVGRSGKKGASARRSVGARPRLK